jgi:hypothetical protein
LRKNFHLKDLKDTIEEIIERMVGQEDEEENVSSCWMTLRKRKDIGN